MSDTQRTILVHPVRRGLCMNDHLSDIKLVVEGHTFAAHRLILAEASAVFNGMWESDMADSRAEEVNISDVSVDVMKIMLQYIYGCLDEVPLEMVLEVFKAADRYGVSSKMIQRSAVLQSTVAHHKECHALLRCKLKRKLSSISHRDTPRCRCAPLVQSTINLVLF